MGLSQIEHVNIVSNATAVCCRIIVAKNHRFFVSFDGVDHNRNQVGHSSVSQVVPAGASNVEVAQID